MIILLLVFLGSVGMIGTILYQYHKIDQLHEAAVVQYTKTQEAARPAQAEPVASGAPVDAPEAIIAPIMVDFEGLRAINPEVVGWIYCEGTGINYPVMQGENNDYYLTHSYDGAYNVSGSIFVEAENRAGFADRNTIIYGHNMKNDSMFAHLDNWAEPGYYEEHPVIWLLTPEQDYQIKLMAGYTTSAYSDTYVFSLNRERNWYPICGMQLHSRIFSRR